jgi:hypothetical protein
MVTNPRRAEVTGSDQAPSVVEQGAQFSKQVIFLERKMDTVGT